MQTQRALVYIVGCMMSFNRSKRGFALSIVLWIVAALLLGVALLGNLSKDTLNLSKGLKNKLQAEFKAQDILEELKFFVPTAQYDSTSLYYDATQEAPLSLPKRIYLDGRWHQVGEDIRISIIDATALINVMYLYPELLANLVTSKDERQKRLQITDCIKDWIDKDDVVSLNGAEASTYRLQKNVTYPIRNSPAIQHPKELELIDHLDQFSEKQKKRLGELVYFGDAASENFALISSEHLAFLLGIEQDYAKSLTQLRESDFEKFVDLVRKEPRFDSEYMGFVISKQFLISIEVKQNNAGAKLYAQIDFRPRNEKNFTILEYKLD